MAVCSSCMLCMHSFPFVPSFFCFIYRTKSGSIDSWIDSSNYMVCVLCAYVCVFSVVDGFRGNIACVLAVASSHRIRLHPIKSFKIASPTRRLSVPYSTIHNTTQHNTAQHQLKPNRSDQPFVCGSAFVCPMYVSNTANILLVAFPPSRSFVRSLSIAKPTNKSHPTVENPLSFCCISRHHFHFQFHFLSISIHIHIHISLDYYLLHCNYTVPVDATPARRISPATFIV